MKKALRNTPLIILMVSGLLLASSSFSFAQTNISSSSSGELPHISLVSPILATANQTITIRGSGFGNTQPQLLDLGDGSVDTVGGGTTPVIRIYDLSSTDSWEAGVQDSSGSGADSIGIILKSWSNDKIVLGGFGSALNSGGSNDQPQWSITAGDPLLIAVLTFNGQAVYTTTVGPNASSITIEPTAITYVSPIAAARNQTIMINGNGFGNIQPQVVNMSDGLVDTVAADTTPVIRIYDEEGLDSWEAGCQDAISSGPIGINLVSWSDHQIVLGGFGSELSVNRTGPWNINPGDPLIVDVLTSNGQAAYTLTAASNSTTPQSNPLKTTLTVSCQSLTALSSFQVSINGNLSYQGIGIPDATIALYYSINEGSTWQQLTTVNTDANGNFVAEWLPSVTGNYMLNATYAGDTVYPAASTIVNFVMTPDLSGNPQVAFSIASNSTVTDFTFNSTSQQLSFVVSGPSGTHGYADVYIAKSLVNGTSNIKAYIDNNSESFTVSSNANSWILQLSYHLCTHQIIVDLNSQAAHTMNLSGLLWGTAYGLAVSIGVIVALLLFLRRDKNKKTAPVQLSLNTST